MPGSLLLGVLSLWKLTMASPLMGQGIKVIFHLKEDQTEYLKENWAKEVVDSSYTAGK